MERKYTSYSMHIEDSKAPGDTLTLNIDSYGMLMVNRHSGGKITETTHVRGEDIARELLAHGFSPYERGKNCGRLLENTRIQTLIATPAESQEK
jgi:hypothetical protein